MDPRLRPNLSTFNSAFEGWRHGAQQKNANNSSILAQIAKIKRTAQQSFISGQDELDVSALSASLNTKLLSYAEAHYHAAFLVATCSLEQLVNKWVEEKNTINRKALLLAVINASHISDERLYQFLISVGIKAKGKWFIYKHKPTPAYHACFNHHKLTPKELYIHFKDLIHPIAAKQPATTPPPVANVQPILPKPVLLERICVPFFLTANKTHAHLLNMQEFTDSASIFNWKAIEQQAYQGISDMTQRGNCQVAYQESECKEMINNHAWYKNANCSIVAKLSIDKAALGRIELNSAINGMCKGVHSFIHHAATPAHLQIKSLHPVENRPINLKIQNCYAVSHPNLLETVKPDKWTYSAYFFQSKERGLGALLFHTNGNKEWLYFDEMDLLPSIRQKLNELHIPQEGIVQVPVGLHNVVAACYQEKIQSSFSLINLHFKVKKLKEIAKGKAIDGQEVTEALIKNITYMEEEVNAKKYTKSHLMAAMDKVLLQGLNELNEVNTKLLFQGLRDKKSILSSLPEELIQNIIKLGLEADEQRIKDLKKIYSLSSSK